MRQFFQNSNGFESSNSNKNSYKYGNSERVLDLKSQIETNLT